MDSYFERLRKIKLGQLPKEAVRKKPVPLKKVSAKKKEELKIKAGSDSEMDIFFAEMRKRMKGRCLFTGEKSLRDDDERFHFSIAHLLPKRHFKSVATHPENWVELSWDAHTDFDNGKISWLTLRDSKEWDILYEKLLLILPAVAEEERKHKLYSFLNQLIYGK